MSFTTGFCKVAGLSEDLTQNTLLDGAIGVLPLGTTLSTVLGERPKDHSRLGEFASRFGLGTAGAIAGGALTRGRGGFALGALLGGAGGSYLVNKKYYDKDGKLLRKYKSKKS